MTYTVLPIGSGGTPMFSAGQERLARSSMMFPSGPTRPLGARSGRRVGWGLDVSLVGTTIHIAPGSGILDVENPVATGPYQFANDTDDSSLGAITAASGIDRIDGVYLQLSDNDVDASGAGLYKVAPVYVAGTVANTPPTTPARAFRLALMTVPHSGGGSPSVTNDRIYTVAAGGILPVPSSAFYPLSAYEGMIVDDASQDCLYRFDGAAWNPIGMGAVFATNTRASDATSASGVAAGFASLTITLPAAGILLMTGTYRYKLNSPSGNPSFQFVIDGTPQNAVIQGAAAVSTGDDIFSNSLWVPVNAGAHTVAMQVNPNGPFTVTARTASFLNVIGLM